MRLSLLVLALLCALAALAAPAGAATTLTTDGADLTVTADPGVANDVAVAPGLTPGTVAISDGADVVTPAPGCTALAADAAECPVSGTVTLDLGDGDDRLAAATAPVALAVRGGDGADTLDVGNGHADDVACGAGADDASAADAQDTLAADCEETLLTAGAPGTSIATGTAATTRQTSATFAFSATEPATFQCALDGAAFAACGATRTYSGLTDGGHTLRVRAVDLVGNTDADPARFAWVVDTRAPATWFTAAPAALTNDTTPAFALAAPDAATFECGLDGAAFSACTATPSFVGLAEGAHTLRVRSTDAAGNSAVVSYTWTQDSVRPQTQLTGGPASSIAVNSAQATFSFAAQAATGFQCTLDAGPWRACANPATYGALADGAHSFAVRAVDAAGNVDGTPATRSWTVRVDDAPVARIAVRRDGDGFALDAGGSTDPTGGALTYRWQRAGQAAGATATIHYTAPDHEARDTFTVTVVDPGGHRGQATVALVTRATTQTAPQEAMDVIRFGAGTRLAAGAKARIAALRAATAAAGSTVRIEGYSQPGAGAARVAKARAKTVRRLLGGPARTTIVARGAAGAVASNATPAGRARNDRVVVTVGFRGPAPRLVTAVEGGAAVSRSNAPQPVAGSARALKLFAFWSAVPGALRRLEEVGGRVDVLAPNWYTLSPASAAIGGGRPNARIAALSRKLGFAVWPVVNATMHGSALLDTPSGRSRIVTSISALAARYRLAGVTLDMEEMLPRQKASYSALVAQLGAALHARHRKLAVYAVRRTATDVDDGAAAYDWPALARSADLVLASGYNEHSATTTPGPVTTQAGFAALAGYAAATSRTKVAPVMGAFGYQWSGGAARMLSSADAERRWPVRAETGSADGRAATGAPAPTFFESAEDLWARERAASQAGARWIGLFSLGREPDRFWERSAAR